MGTKRLCLGAHKPKYLVDTIVMGQADYIKSNNEMTLSPLLLPFFFFFSISINQFLCDYENAATS